ncbi:MAG: 50S ribosomal protein L4 [Nitrospirae bacterium]|nr:50S ribosomal protein L4 [Nitrospirota bacterium]
MIETQVIGIDNNPKGKINISKEIYGCEVNGEILHTAVVNFLANQRQGTHATKTIGMVRGGGKKPWKQKHTGRARHGSSRSTIWKGGATTFGPSPRDYSYNLNKKVKRLALKNALSSKFSNGEIIVLDTMSSMFAENNKPSTKKMLNVLNGLGLARQSVLIVLEDRDDNIVMSSRNLINIDVAKAIDITTYDVLNHDKVIIIKGALEVINNRLLKVDA